MKPTQMCYWTDRQTDCVKQMVKQFRRSEPTMPADPLDPRPLVDSVGDRSFKAIVCRYYQVNPGSDKFRD